MGAIPVVKVPDQVMIEYKGRLAQRLMHFNTNTVVIEEHPELKQYIENYVTANVITTKGKDALNGIVKKLALLNAKLPNNLDVTYPIIHTYRGHNLVETTIFYIDEEGKYCHEVIPLQKSAIVIP